MKETNNGSQLSFGEAFSSIKRAGKSITIFQPKLTGQEEINRIDESIKQEIPDLRIVKKNEVILVPTLQTGYFTRVFLEQPAILKRLPCKDHPKRFDYYLRAPVLVQSTEYRNKWQVEQGKKVDTFSKQRKIPKKLIPEVVFRLRRYTKLA